MTYQSSEQRDCPVLVQKFGEHLFVDDLLVMFVDDPPVTGRLWISCRLYQT